MSKAKQLIMGVDSLTTPSQRAEGEEILRATVEKYIPNFATAVAVFAHKEGKPGLLQHQDAFAAGYHDDEYTLLGMAIKYAGLFGVRVTVGGTNRETIETTAKTRASSCGALKGARPCKPPHSRR